jgi:hypothetical protein
MLVNRYTGETVIDHTDTSIVYTLESFMWIEQHLEGRTVTEVLERGRRAYFSIKELQVLVWAGMEAHRRRRGSHGGQVNPAKALKVIEDGGGLTPVAMQVMEALMRSTALGLNPDKEPEAIEAGDPTMAGESLSDSPAPEFSRTTPAS